MTSGATSRRSRRIYVGDIPVGGGARIAIQSMVRRPTQDAAGVVEEIARMSAAGAALVRVALARESEISALKTIISESPVPIIADVHYPLDLAVKAVEAGVAGVRINPLIPADSAVYKKLTSVLKKTKAAVRVGVNAGGLPPGRDVTMDSLLNPLWETVNRLADDGVENIKISAKSSHIDLNMRLNRALAAGGDRPIHLGFTEAGGGVPGTVRSIVALAPLLSEGIGDTLRISLSGSPIDEIRAAKSLLRALGLRDEGVEIIACPMCGRARGDVSRIVEKLQEEFEGCRVSLTVAVMGCEINGPGEASRCDLGIAAARDGWLLFSRGKNLQKCGPREGPQRLVEEVLKKEKLCK